MNQLINSLVDTTAARLPGVYTVEYESGKKGVEFTEEALNKFVELIKQAIYNDVKEELMEDAIINAEPDRVSREYLKGYNGGTVDALYHINNFGVEV
jgi:hypothetical protein